MPLFTHCINLCFAKELNSVARKSNGNILSDEKKKNTTKHDHEKKKKRENKEHKKRESNKYSKSKGPIHRSKKNQHNTLNLKKKNIHKNEKNINRQDYPIEKSTYQINTINKMKSMNNNNNNKQKESVTLVDEQWNVCYYQDNKNVTLEKVQIMHTVSIYNCNNSTIVIDAEKFKSLQIQNCFKCNVVLKNLISAIEIIDCKKAKVQIKGRCASVTIDKCTGVEIYLSKDNEETEFTTALSAEMNIHIEGNNPDDDWKEITIPEQYQHVLNKGDLTTRVSDLYKF